VQSGTHYNADSGFAERNLIKIEKPGEGDPTAAQLRDSPGADALLTAAERHTRSFH